MSYQPLPKTWRPRRRRCKGCPVLYLPLSQTQVFHNKGCYQNYWARQHRKKRPKVQGPPHSKKGSLQCRWCQAMGDEVHFQNSETCDACYQQKLRFGVCDKCERHILYGQYESVCPACDPPAGTMPVILLDRRYERERVVNRKPLKGCVVIGHRRFLITAIPLVVSLPAETWVKIRK